MADKISMAIPGFNKMPTALKRTVQIVGAMALTSAIVLLVLMGSAMMIGKGTSVQGFNLWLAFIKRPDIFTIMALTSIVTVLFVYWQGDHSRR